MPPPNWIGSLPPTAAAIALIDGSFLGRPAAAPLRSTTCSRRAPSFNHRSAVAAGSSENTVDLSIAPCFRRTHLPSFRSMAGMSSIRSGGGRRRGAPRGALRRGLPLHEVREQPQAGLGALLGVELHGENIGARGRAGERHAVDALARGELASARHGK